MASSRISVVDIGGGHTAAGVFSPGADGKLVLQHFALETLPVGPAGETAWSASTGAALRTIAAGGKFAGRVSLGIPGHLALTKFIRTPAVEKSKRSKILPFEAAQAIPYPLDEVVWRPVVVAEDGLDLEIMLAAAKTDSMAELCDASRAAGLAVEHATPGCLALLDGFRFNHPEASEHVLLVDIGARSTHLVFVERTRYFVRTLTLAGQALTEAIANTLSLEVAQAELLKIQVLDGRVDLPEDSPARIAVGRAAEDFCTRLQLELARSIALARRQTAGGTPAVLYVTGGGSRLPSLPGTLAAGLKIRVERYDSLRRIALAPRAGEARDASAKLGVLVGLAARLVTKRPSDVSLLPPALRERLAFRRRQPWLLGAAGLLVVALLPPIVHYHRITTSTQADIAELESRLRPMRIVQQRNADNLARFAEAEREIAALRRLVEMKSSWIDFLADLQRRLVEVEDVWLDQLAVVPPPAKEPGAGDRGARSTLHLAVSGRLLDATHPVAKVSADAYDRVKRLLDSFARSPFIIAVEDERFDNRQPGILRFDFRLVVNPDQPL